MYLKDSVERSVLGTTPLSETGVPGVVAIAPHLLEGGAASLPLYGVTGSAALLAPPAPALALLVLNLFLMEMLRPLVTLGVMASRGIPPGVGAPVSRPLPGVALLLRL